MIKVFFTNLKKSTVSKMASEKVRNIFCNWKQKLKRNNADYSWMKYDAYEETCDISLSCSVHRLRGYVKSNAVIERCRSENST